VKTQVQKPNLGHPHSDMQKQRKERFPDSAGRRVRRSERGRESRPAPLGM